MGVYSTYLDAKFSFSDLTKERKKQLRTISRIRGGRDILVFAADLNKGGAPITIGYDDLLPINDQLSNLSGNQLDLILETPGGSGEVAEDIIRLLRAKYNHLGVIVPGYAKSAGTIMAMGADEILMDSASALGPVDAQITWQGKHFSAEALLEGINKIKKEVEETGVLNKAYIPVLQNISPGEIQNAQNALDFAEILVKGWLVQYKFKNWTTHSSTGIAVTNDEKVAKAQEIAKKLRSHSRWLTHGRSIKINDLTDMGLKMTDFSVNHKLSDAIRRYHALLHISFQTNIYKLTETPKSQIYRFINPVETRETEQSKGKSAKQAKKAFLDVRCKQCNSLIKVQANLDEMSPLKDGYIPFPGDNVLQCPSCSAEVELSEVRREIEAQSKKKVVAN